MGSPADPLPARRGEVEESIRVLAMRCIRALQTTARNPCLRKKREAERRKAPTKPAAPHFRTLPSENAAGAAARQGCSRVANHPLARALAFRRSTAAFVAGRTLSSRSRPRFTQRGGRRRYPRHRPRLSQAPGAPVVVPAGTIPGPPGSGVYGSARGNRPRSPSGSTLGRKVPHGSVSEAGTLVTYSGTLSQGNNSRLLPGTVCRVG
jgi:hypothetical protein